MVSRTAPSRVLSRLTLAHGLTADQASFARALAELGDVEAAAHKAGYTSGHAYDLSKRPDIRRAVRDHIQRTLETELAPQALAVYRRALGDPDITWRDLLPAANKVLQMAGFGAPTIDAQNATKPLDQMSIDELGGIIEALGRQIEGTARDVTPPDAQHSFAEHRADRKEIAQPGVSAASEASGSATE